MASKQTKYAYLMTLVGVALAAVATVYSAVRSYVFMQMLRSRPFNLGNFNPGNFTASQFGNYARARSFVGVNPYGGFVGGLMMVAVAIAIIGVVWLGLTLRTEKSP
jgi:hypothetical protein